MATGVTTGTESSVNGPPDQVDGKLERRSRWAVVLSGGEGTRFHGFTRRWLGEDRPKQYCAFTGKRTLLQDTIERATRLIEPQNLITVIGTGHGRHLGGMRQQMPGCVIEQPHDRGTAMGIFLGATYVYERDPDATVVFYPASQFIRPEKAFSRAVDLAYRQAARLDGRLILLGAAPTGPDTEYGWIEPGSQPRRRRAGAVATEEIDKGRPMAVRSFHERSRKSKAEGLMRRGALWNTMIVVARVRNLWAIGWQLFPEVMRRFEVYRQVLRVVRREGTAGQHESVALNHIFRDMKSADFSHELLQYLTSWSMVLPLEGVRWCDLGNPQRLREAMEILGRRPAFPVEYLDKPRTRRQANN